MHPRPPVLASSSSDAAFACVCDPAEKDGYPYIPLIAIWFGDCVRTPTEILSFSSGLLSLFCYVFALFPQLWLNFQRKSVEGLSGALLVLWAFGDCCNLVGTILTNQLATQVDVAVYFVAVDIVIVLQYLWYSSLRIRLLGRRPREGSQDHLQPLLPPHSGEPVPFYGTAVSPTHSSPSQSGAAPTATSGSRLQAAAAAVAVAVACCCCLADVNAVLASTEASLDLIASLGGSDGKPKLCDERAPMTPV
ncbi:PQ loop repeat-containing protein 2, partial [Cladochytrium tenue]